MANKWEKTVSISETGDKTFEQFIGDFTFKTLLSHDEYLMEDRIRRELLVGPEQVAPSPEAANTAAIFGQLAVRIVSAPTWWTENRNGRALFDNNIVAEVYAKAREAEAEQLEALRKKQEAARAKLASTPPVNGDGEPEQPAGK
jgi:hypothetical protein